MRPYKFIINILLLLLSLTLLYVINVVSVV